MANFTDFGKRVKIRLIDINCDQNWLIEQVRQKTGLYFDSSYLWKIMVGRAKTPSIVKAICEILELEEPE